MKKSVYAVGAMALAVLAVLYGFHRSAPQPAGNASQTVAQPSAVPTNPSNTERSSEHAGASPVGSGHRSTAAPVGPGTAKPHTPQWPMRPEGRIKNYLPGLLAAAAAGDAEAAYLAAHSLSMCRFIPIWKRNLRSASPNDPEQASLRLDLEKLEQDCEGVSESEIAGRIALMQQAAERGHEAAQLAYLTEVGEILEDHVRVVRNPEEVIQIKERAVRYLIEGSQNGSLGAMYKLSLLYTEGIFVKADPVFAYAYAYAHSYAAASTGVLPGAEQLASLRRNGLSPDQVRTAEGLGQQLLRRCCGIQ